MKKFALPFAVLGATVALFLHAAPAQAQATRTWVSGVGDDANPCSRTAPCKTFAGAISKTAAGGEINCIDPGGFGAVTITKSMTIDCDGTFGSILAVGTNGIIINGPANTVVRIRNLSIQGAGTGLNGIRWIASSGQLHVENVRIMGFTTKGIDFIPSGNAELFVSDTIISEVGGVVATNAGIFVRPTAAAGVLVLINRTSTVDNAAGMIFDSTATSNIINATVRDSTITGNTNNGITALAGAVLRVQLDRTAITANATGISAGGANTVVQLFNSTVTQNATGLSGSTITSFQSNVLSGNTANGSPTSTVPLQ